MSEKNKPQDDLSIEEILGSIRRIIADDDNAGSPVVHNDAEEGEQEALELTQKIEEDGSITDLSRRDEPSATDSFQISLSDESGLVEDLQAPAYQKNLVPPVTDTPSNANDSFMNISLAEEPIRMSRQEDELVSTDNLLSSTTAEATSAVMAKLARHTAIVEQPGAVQGLTIEGMVRDMLRPMLREWLDSNLPGMVETMVARELEKLTKRL